MATHCNKDGTVATFRTNSPIGLSENALDLPNNTLTILNNLQPNIAQSHMQFGTEA